MNKYFIIIILFLIIVSGIYLIYSGTRDEVIIKHENYRTSYSLKAIPIELEVFQGVNEGVWRIRSNSGQSIDSQITVMDKLLSRALSDQKKPPRTFMVGRLEESFGGNKEISRRLSLAAKTSPLWVSFMIKMSSPLWDATTVTGNKEVKTILNENNIYRELVDMFKKHGLIIKVRSVEKVLINENKLPFDCQVWFSVEPDR
jgi:hypothetical protein